MNLGWLDFTAILIYLIIVVVVGLRVKTGDKSQKEFFLGGKNLPWYIILFSIIATETSSLTFLSVPAISFGSDLSFLQLALGFIIGRYLVAYFLLPGYRKGEYSSVYEWIGEALGPQTQKSLSTIFIITRLLADGVRLFVTSIPLSLILYSFFKDSLSSVQIGIFSLLIISLFTILYTVYGGFRSVVITDSIQFFIYIGGGLFSFIYILSELSSQYTIAQIFETLKLSGKFQFYRGMGGDFFKTPYYGINAIFGGILISLGSHGVDQLIAQRSLACKTEKESKRALILSGYLVFLQFVLFLGIGLLLFLYYKGEKGIIAGDVFSKYIVERIPSPFAGIILAAILASAMSTLSSSINSLSLAAIVDWKPTFVQKFEESRVLRYASIFWGLVLFASSLIPYLLIENARNELVQLGLKIASFTFGPMIAVFMLIRIEEKNLVNISPRILLSSVFLSLSSAILLNFVFQPDLSFIIPAGILSFFLFFYSGKKIFGSY
ncbi:MAG: sodium:solute symporter [Leptospiraceae bacterium]|nr:sodium:solute symporter [Leptospiraceae bacterium]